MNIRENFNTADFLALVSFSYDMSVFVSTSNIPGNSHFFMFQAKQRMICFATLKSPIAKLLGMFKQFLKSIFSSCMNGC